MAGKGIAILGAGYMGLHHLRVFRRLHADGLIGHHATWICDLNAVRLEEARKKYEVPHASTDVEDALNDEEVGAVFVATPWPTHHRLALRALDKGKALYCEKPLASNAAEAEDMARAATLCDLPCQAGLLLRFSPTLWALKRLVQEGSLGRPQLVRFREDAAFPEGGIHRTTWTERLQGRGILWEENIHDLDTLIYVFGPLTVRNSRLIRHPDFPGVEIGSLLDLETADGCPVRFESLWHGIAGRGSSRSLEVFLEHGHVATDYFVDGDILIRRSGHKPERLLRQDLRTQFVRHLGESDLLCDGKRFPWYATFSDLAFVRALERGQRPAPDLGDALEVHRLLEVLYSVGTRVV